MIIESLDITLMYTDIDRCDDFFYMLLYYRGRYDVVKFEYCEYYNSSYSEHSEQHQQLKQSILRCRNPFWLYKYCVQMDNDLDVVDMLSKHIHGNFYYKKYQEWKQQLTHLYKIGGKK